MKTNNKRNRKAFSVKDWKKFAVGDLFDIINGKGITSEEIAEHPGKLPAIQSGETDDGCMGYIDEDYCKSMNYSYVNKPCLTVARSGSAGYVGFRNYGCVVGDSAKILTLKDSTHATLPVYLFLRTVLMANKYKYDYGRKVTEDKYLTEKLKLPVVGNIPDWEFMEDYIKSLPYGDRI